MMPARTACASPRDRNLNEAAVAGTHRIVKATEAVIVICGRRSRTMAPRAGGEPCNLPEPSNGLEMSRPPTRASPPSLYAGLAGKTSVHFSQLGGSAPSSC